MRGIKILFGTTALLAGLALAPTAQAQIVVDIYDPARQIDMSVLTGGYTKLTACSWMVRT